MNVLAMLQFTIGGIIILGIGVWLLYFFYIRHAVKKMSIHDLSEEKEVQLLTSFRVLPEERKVVAIKLLKALK